MNQYPKEESEDSEEFAVWEAYGKAKMNRLANIPISMFMLPLYEPLHKAMKARADMEKKELSLKLKMENFKAVYGEAVLDQIKDYSASSGHTVEGLMELYSQINSR